VSRSPSAISAEELLAILRDTELDVPIPLREDPRCERLRPEVNRNVSLPSFFRGALVGAAVEDVVGQPNERVWPSAARARRIIHSWRQHDQQHGTYGVVDGWGTTRRQLSLLGSHGSMGTGCLTDTGRVM